MNNNNKCSECKYQLVCKYVDDFKKFDEELERLKKLLQAEGINLSIINAEIKCQFFASENTFNSSPTIRDLLIQYSSKDDYDTINKQNPCDYCPNKPDPNKMVIGDSPCQWCKHNPFKITCH